MDGAGGSAWAIVLAAGDGTRLRSLTTSSSGLSTPKQYCRFGGERSLLRMSLDRAGRLVPRHRVLVVVAARHARWWEPELAGLPPENVVVQPENRGTAPGLLLPLRRLMRRDPQATLLVLPADHHVSDEDAFCAHLDEALNEAQQPAAPVVLVGIAADEPESGYGWILPGARAGAVREVLAFVEKPSRRRAMALMLEGGLWSSFVLAAQATALERLYSETLPELVRSFSRLPEQALEDPRERCFALDRLYQELPVSDFSSQVLQESRPRLRVLEAAYCGWSDLGTPERVARWLSRRDSVSVAAVRARFARPAEPVGVARVAGAAGAAATPAMRAQAAPGGAPRTFVPQPERAREVSQA